MAQRGAHGVWASLTREILQRDRPEVHPGPGPRPAGARTEWTDFDHQNKRKICWSIMKVMEEGLKVHRETIEIVDRDLLQIPDPEPESAREEGADSR